MTSSHYDYIIAGGGMAGLSLAYYFNQSSLRTKKILIIDREPKDKNDRTWCFWEKGESAFEPIVHRHWQKIWFHGTNFSERLDLTPYQYKMIRGIDFYTFVHTQLNLNPNINFLYSSIHSVSDEGVVTDLGTFSAEWIFDSTYRLQLNQVQNHNLLQHFKGWIVKTPSPVFDTEQATMMDFRIDQGGDCRFFYVLPSSPTEALIEYTVFSEKLLHATEYDASLRDYFDKYLNIKEFEVIQEEFGVIPMTDEPTQEHPSERVLRIGTAGGSTKPSTGYTFMRTQRNLQEMVENLVDFGEPFRWKEPLKKRFYWYDSIFLNVFEQKLHPPKNIFTHLFKRNRAAKVFEFLDEETPFPLEFSLMATLPIKPFLKGLIGVISRKMFG